MAEFRKMRVRFFLSLVVLVATYALVIAFREKAIEMLSEIPEGFKKMMGREFLEKLANDPEFYAVSQWNWKNLAQMIPIISVVIGFPLFAREIERGTIYFLLSNFTRGDVFLRKLSTGLVAITILSATALLPILNGLPLKTMSLYFVHTLVASVFWFMLSLTFSILFDDQVKPLLLSLGVFALVVVLEAFKKAKMISYIGDRGILQGGGIDACMTAKLSLISLGLVMISFYIFKNREF